RAIYCGDLFSFLANSSCVQPLSFFASSPGRHEFRIYARGHKVQKTSEQQSTSDVGLGLVFLLCQLLLRPAATVEQQSKRSVKPGGMDSGFITVVIKFKKRPKRIR